MLKLYAGIFGAALLLAACTSEPKTTGEAPAEASANAANTFGAAITADNAMPYDQLVARMAAVDSLPAKVTGKVGEVCQKKGCCMTLASDQPGQPEMRVTFKDYEFFVPKDLSGKRVTVEGYALVEETPVEMLRHYAEDAGKAQAEIDAITAPEREMTFVATGVLVEQ